MAKSALEVKVAEARTEIARLEGIVAFLTMDTPAEPSETAPKAKRGRKKKGLPVDSATTGE